MARFKMVLGILVLLIYTPALGCNNKSENSFCSVIKPGHFTPYNTTWTMGCLLEGDSVSKIKSYNHFSDRKWNFDCRPSKLTIKSCSLIGPSLIGRWKMHYMCKGGIISGFKTVYRPTYKDRVWMFYCCPVFETLACNKSGYVNEVHQDLSFNIPLGYYLHGVESFREYGSTDERWIYTTCQAVSQKPRSIISTLECNTDKYLSLDVAVTPGFYTPYNKTWIMGCKQEESISKVQSNYDDHFMDRKWKFDCRSSNINIKSCSMVITKQRMMDRVLYRCKGGIITGFKTVFSFEVKDRVWMFYCCPVAGALVDCKNSYYKNGYTEDFDFDIPQGYHLHGVEGYHSSHYSHWDGHTRDRCWSYTYCKVAAKKPLPIIPNFDCKKFLNSVRDIMPGQCTPYLERWNMKCLNKGDSISKVQSHHDVFLDDRTWKFECRPSNLKIKNCFIDGTGQETFSELQYSCKGGIIAGFEAIGNYDPEKDQLWLPYCCPVAETLVYCKTSSYVNHFYKDFYFDIPQGYYLHGFEGFHEWRSWRDKKSHDPFARDRRWRYTFCKVASKNITGQ